MRFLPPWFVFASAAALVGLAGCGDVLYLAKLGWHQGAILYRCVPVEEVLEDSESLHVVKWKLRLIQDVKRYGQEQLGLKNTGSYTKFVQVQRPILYVVTACEKDRLQLRSWRFPIVGEVTYKGFFTKEDALEERKRLDAEGLDTFVHGVDAYSTLGWMRDPIFSPMLAWRPATLADVILHEMAHGTVYFKDDTAFNERAATFVGNMGAIHFLQSSYGPAAKETLEALAAQADDLVFARWIDQGCKRLSALYAREIPREEKLKEREEIFRALKSEFKETEVQFRTDSYTGFEKLNLNNAVLLAYRRYLHRLEELEAFYEGCGRDLRCVVNLLKQMQRSGRKPFS